MELFQLAHELLLDPRLVSGARERWATNRLDLGTTVFAQQLYKLRLHGHRTVSKIIGPTAIFEGPESKAWALVPQ